MNLFPTSSGARPRLACEIAPEAVVAARSEEPAGPLAAVARVPLPESAITPGLKPGNIADRVAVITAVRRALEQVGGRPNGRRADITLIVPDGAARVLLLDFDALPGKLSEALPVVRFRLKKQLPFDADDAVISYQVMSGGRNLVRVLAVAMPRDVLREYETLAREAGFEPGAILPSTLAALPGLNAEEPALIVNSSRSGITTAILQGNTLLLHRSVDLQDAAVGTPAGLPVALFESSGLPLTHADPADSPYASPAPDATLSAELQHAVLVTPASLRSLLSAEAELAFLAAAALDQPLPSRQQPLSGDVVSGHEDEVAQAISVAVAYFEDTLSAAPVQMWNAGSRSAEALAQLLARRGLADTEGLRVRELVESSALLAAATSNAVPRSTLAGVMGALRG